MEVKDHSYFKSENIGPVDKTFHCHVCTTIFKHRGSLYNHLRAVHKVKNIGKKPIKCLEENCNECFRQLLKLEKHLKEEHFREIEKEELLFGSLEEFKAWKSAMEEDTGFEYVTYSPRRSAVILSVMYFKCSRSGFYKEKPAPGTRKRRLKSQGSKKSGAHCISRMIIHINNNSKSVSVNFCKTHYGHCMESSHLSLSKIEKEKIADIENTHKKALQFPKGVLKKKSTSAWIFISQQDCISDCIIERADPALLGAHQCNLRCISCDCCVHIYTCTCSDYLIKGSMCEHIHTVAWNQKESMVQVSNEINRPQLTPVVTGEINFLTEEVTADFNIAINCQRERILSILQSLMVKVKAETSIEKLNAVTKFLKYSESLLDLKMTSSPNETKECLVLGKRPKKKIGLLDKWSYPQKKQKN